MATYVLLLTLTPDGRERAAGDPQSVADAEAQVSVPGVNMLGLYGVLGEYDFVAIVEADDNETVARFSLELGVAAGVHVETMPAIPITRLESSSRPPGVAVELDVPEAMDVPGESGVPGRVRPGMPD